MRAALEELEADERADQTETNEREERKRQFRLLKGGGVAAITAGVLTGIIRREAIAGAIAGGLTAATVTLAIVPNPPAPYRPPPITKPAPPITKPPPRHEHVAEKPDPAPPASTPRRDVAPSGAGPKVSVSLGRGGDLGSAPVDPPPRVPIPPPPEGRDRSPRLRDDECALGVDLRMLPGELGDRLARGLLCDRTA